MWIYFSALTSYLNTVHGVDFPPNQQWYCALGTSVLWTSTLCSTLFILTMTFDRFYSIIKPHKAASFNTVKRAKITIVCIVIFSILFNIPYLFTISHEGRVCIPLLQGRLKIFYYWLCYVVQFIIPFVSLLTMNSIIIHKLRMRKHMTLSQGQGQSEGQKINSSEKQIFAILLLVAFSFFILVTPLYAFNLYSMVFDYTKTPERFAGFYLFYNIIHKLYFTNNGINFFLYVIFGHRFRNDLFNLFTKIKTPTNSLTKQSGTVVSVIENLTIWYVL